MFKPEHGTQDSLVCQLCCNKENKTSAEAVAQRFFLQKTCFKKSQIHTKKNLSESLFNKVVGCKIFG